MKLTNSATAIGGLANICVGAAIVGTVGLTGLVLPTGATVAAFGGNAVLGHLGEQHRRSLTYAIRKFRKELERNWRKWAAGTETGADADVDSAIAAFETVMADISVRPEDLVAQRLDPRKLADLMVAKAEAVMPAAYGRRSAGTREATLARKFLWELTHAAFAHLIGIQEFVEAIQPALWTGLFEELDQLEAQLAEGLESQANRIAEMEHRLMAAIEAGADRNAVSQDALLALARRVAADVSDPAQALKELEKAVEIAVSIQNSAHAEQGSLAEAAALAARGQHDAASHAIDAAIAQAEQGHRQLIGKFLSAGIEQDRLRRDAPSVAEKIVRAADLAGPEPASFDALFKIWMKWFTEGRDRGLLLELSVAGELAGIMKTRANTAEERGRAMNLLGIVRHTKGEREAGLSNLLGAVGAFEEALWEWEPSAHPAHWAKAQMNMANTQHALAQRDLGNDRIHRAIASYEAALEGHRKLDDGPMVAMTLMNLGTALRTLAQTDQSADAARRSIATIQEALSQYADTPNQRLEELSHLNLAMSQRVLAALNSDSALMHSALDALEDCANRWQDAEMGFYRVTALLQTGAACMELALMTSDARHFHAASSALQHAIAGLDHVDAPVDRLTATGMAAVIELALASADDARKGMVQTAQDRVADAVQALQDAGHRRGADEISRLSERIRAAALPQDLGNSVAKARSPALADEPEG